MTVIPGGIGVSVPGGDAGFSEVAPPPQSTSPLLNGGVTGRGIGGGVTQITAPTQNTTTNTYYDQPLNYSYTNQVQLPNLFEGLSSSAPAAPSYAPSAPMQFAPVSLVSAPAPQAPHFSLGTSQGSNGLPQLTALPTSAVQGGWNGGGPGALAPAGLAGGAGDWGYGPPGSQAPIARVAPDNGYPMGAPQQARMAPAPLTPYPTPQFSMPNAGAAPMGGGGYGSMPPAMPMPGEGDADPGNDADAYDPGDPDSQPPAMYPPQGYARRNGGPQGYYQQQLANMQPPLQPFQPDYGRLIRQVNPEHSKWHNFFKATAAGLNPALAAQQAAETRARADITKELMQESARDYRAQTRQGEAQYAAEMQSRTRMASAELTAAAQNKPKPSDGLRALNQAMQMTIRSPEELQTQIGLLRFASEATGQDYSAYAGRTSPKAAALAQHALNTLTIDSQHMYMNGQHMQMNQQAIDNAPTKQEYLQARLHNAQNQGTLGDNRVGNIPISNQILQNRAAQGANMATISGVKANNALNPQMSGKDIDQAEQRSLSIQNSKARLAKLQSESQLLNGSSGGNAPAQSEGALIRPPKPGLAPNAQIADMYVAKYGTAQAARAAAIRDGWAGGDSPLIRPPKPGIAANMLIVKSYAKKFQTPDATRAALVRDGWGL